MSKLVESNIYRCLSYCPNCPFKDDGKAIKLVKGRVDEIKEMLLESHVNSFNCHKTVYNLDVNMEPVTTHKQQLKMCYGAYKYLKDNGKQNLQMELYERFYGKED